MRPCRSGEVHPHNWVTTGRSLLAADESASQPGIIRHHAGAHLELHTSFRCRTQVGNAGATLTIRLQPSMFSYLGSSLSCTEMCSRASHRNSQHNTKQPYGQNDKMSRTNVNACNWPQAGLVRISQSAVLGCTIQGSPTTPLVPLVCTADPLVGPL